MMGLKDYILHSGPVARLSGSEFTKQEGFTLTELVGKYFKMIGKIAISPQFGNVTLDEKGAQDSFAHGIGRTKAIAFAAVIKMNLKENRFYLHEVLSQKTLMICVLMMVKTIRSINKDM